MGKLAKAKPAAQKGRNDARISGKKGKSNPGVAPGAHPGKTVGGYSPAKLRERAEKRQFDQIFKTLPTEKTYELGSDLGV